MDGPSFWPAGATSASDASADSPVHELSAFLASAASSSASSASSALLDELLGVDEGDQLTNRAPSTAFQATARLLQLEDNYERKKKRAKINRKDLNARFQELMELLGLREDRKLNRAKVLEKAIEHIEQLSDELRDARAQLGQGGGGAAGAAANKQMDKQPAMLPVPVRRLPSQPGMQHIGSAAMGTIVAGHHSWTAAASSGIPMTSMVWVPCPVVGHPMAAGLPAASSSNSAASDKRRSLKRTRDGSIDSAASVSSLQSSASATERRIAPQSPVQSSTSLAVHEIPTVLEFCDAWTLASVMQTCKELERAARREDLWAALVQCRWRVTMTSPRRVPAFQQWAVWHSSNRMPECSAVTVSILV